MAVLPGHYFDVGAAVASAASERPMQAVDATVIVDVPGPVRGTVAFVLMLLVGGAIAWRFAPFLDSCVDASIERPLASVGYGVAAHAVIAFAGVYLSTQLAGAPRSEWNAGVLGIFAGLFLVLVASALGFTVVGATIAVIWLDGPEWATPVVGALLAGGSAAVDPLVGGLVWFVVVSTGIGGAVRRWIHASAGPDPSTVRRE